MSRHGRAKQHGPEPPTGIYTKPPPPVHGNNTYNGRAAHHHYQQQSQQQHHQQLLQEQFYGGVQPHQQQLQSSVVGTRPASSSYHHHSLPRNAWSADRHAHAAAGGSSSTSSNERTYTINRRAKHHRVYNSYRQPSRTLHKGVGGGATTDPDALSSVTTAGVKYGQQPPQQLHHQSQHQLHNRPQMVAAAVAWPPESSAVHHHQQPTAPSPTAAVAHYPPPSLPPLNGPAAAAATVPRQPAPAAGLPTAATRHHQHLHTATVPLLLSSGDVAVDACGGHCPRFENFCHFCLMVFYFWGITVGFLLIMAAVVTTRDSRFLYIGGLVLPVSAFLMAVQCRVRRDADRRKRHRQLNGRYHHRSNAAAIAVNSNNGGAGAVAAETIPLQNIIAVGAGENTVRRQFQGSVYQYVGQRDESNYTGANSHHYETASDLQQIEGVPWWRREDNRQYHGRAPHL